MTLSQSQTLRAAAFVTAAWIAALAMAGCSKPAQQAASDPVSPTAGAPNPASEGGLVVAAPADVKAPPAGVVVPPNPNAAGEANEDNARVAEMAKQFEADPAALERQNGLCGAGNQEVDVLYAESHGVETDGLRRFRVACMAKRVAQLELQRHSGKSSGGVQNTGSL